MMARRRDKHISVRVSQDEYETLRARANVAGLTLSNYILTCCVDEDPRFHVARLPGSKRSLGDGRRGESARASSVERPSALSAKTERVDVRCTPEEKGRLQETASSLGLTLTDFVIASSLNGGVTVVNWDGGDEIKKVVGELGKQGGNLNQIAMKINRIASIAWREDVDGDLIERLIREVTEDNERTRALINDAVREAYETIRDVRNTNRVRGRTDGD